MTFRSCLVLLCFFFLNEGTAQTLKVAIFDRDSMVRMLPEHKMVDRLTNALADSLLEAYDTLQSEYSNLSNLRLCHNCNSIFNDSVFKCIQVVTVSLIYWQDIVKRITKERISTWSVPLYEKVDAVFRKVMADSNYTLVRKPNCIEVGSNADNLFLIIAREMHLPFLPNHLYYADTGRLK